MATIKIACPKCGQKVSGDDSFRGAVVECPVCSANIRFPGERQDSYPTAAGDSSEEERDLSSDPLRGSETRGLHWEEPPPQALQEDGPPGPGEDRGDLAEEELEEAEPPTPLLGALSLVSSLLGLVTCVGGILFAPLAIIFGHMALARARRSLIQPAPGQTLGTIGLLIGYICLMLTILVLALLILFGEPMRAFLKDRLG